MSDDPFGGFGGDTDRGGEALVWNLFSQIMIPIIILVTYVAVDGVTRIGGFLQREHEISKFTQEKYAECMGNNNATCSKDLRQVYAQNQWDRLLLALERRMRAERKALLFDDFQSAAQVKFDGIRIVDPGFQSFTANVATRFGRAATRQIDYVRNLFNETITAAGFKDDLTSASDAEIAQAIARPRSPDPKDFEVPATTSDPNRLIPQVREQFLARVAAECAILRDDAQRVQIDVVAAIYHALQDAPQQQLTARSREAARRMLESGISEQERKDRAEAFSRLFNADLAADLHGQRIDFLAETWDALNAD
jgi:hypothetical protein